MNIAVMTPTCGRWNYLQETIRTFERNWPPAIPVQRLIIDDSGRTAYKPNLPNEFIEWDVVENVENEGFAAAIQIGWDTLQKEYEPFDYVFHLEDDFAFSEVIPVNEMIEILEANVHLAQVVLKRQAWSPEEIAVGGIIEKAPGEYMQKGLNGLRWVEHTNFFSTTPSLYPAKIMDLGWPQVEQSEGMFTFELRDLGYRFAFYGNKEDPPRVKHIGNERTGKGY